MRGVAIQAATLVAALGEGPVSRGARLARWDALWSLLWRERGPVGLALACAVGGPVAALAIPIAAKLVIDDVIGRGRSELLLPIAIGGGLAVLVQALAAFGAAQAGSVAGHRALARLRRRLQHQALRLPVAYFDHTSTGTLVSRLIDDTDQVRALFGQGILQLVSSALTATLAFAVLTWLDWRLSMLVGVALGLGAIGLRRGFAVLHPAFHAVSERRARLTSRLTEVIGGVRVVKSCGAERRESLGFVRASHRLLRASVGAHRQVAVLAAAIALASGGVSLGLLVLGGQAVVRGAMTLGDLALFVFLVGLLGTPLIQMAVVGGEVGRALAALDRVHEVLALPTDGASSPARSLTSTVVGAVTFEDVSYAYAAGRPVLRNVTLHAAPGATVAVLGANGAGKSTLLALLAAFDDPTAGRILIDGRPLATLDRVAYRRHLGVVLQRDQLLDGTIADNIRYARPAASAAEVRRAARLAHCDEFVEQLPRGYDTVVGERGVRLSGGQGQRVAIARAFLADPQILLLDEAMAHLDSKSEELIAEALAELWGGRTTFVATHRLETMRRADLIIMLEKGRVVEQGMPNELLSKRGRYWQLVHAADPARGERAYAN